VLYNSCDEDVFAIVSKPPVCIKDELHDHKLSDGTPIQSNVSEKTGVQFF
jgi:hypothetical protein